MDDALVRNSTVGEFEWGEWPVFPDPLALTLGGWVAWGEVFESGASPERESNCGDWMFGRCGQMVL